MIIKIYTFLDKAKYFLIYYKMLILHLIIFVPYGESNFCQRHQSMSSHFNEVFLSLQIAISINEFTKGHLEHIGGRESIRWNH